MLKDLYSPDILVKAEEIAAKIAVAKTGTAVYAAVFSGKKKPYHFKNRACHAGLERDQGRSIKNAKMIVTGLWSKKPNHCDCQGPGSGARMLLGDEQFTAIAKKYYSWLINHSIWREVFADERTSVLMKRRAFFIRTDVYDTLMFQACCATRSMWENARRMIVWNKMVESGIDPAVAYLFCPHFQEINPAEFPDAKYQYIYYRGSGGHWPLPVASFDVCKIIKFRKGDTTGIYRYRETYEKSGSYGSANVYWTGRREWRITEYMENILHEQGIAENPIIKIPELTMQKWGGMRGKFTAESMVAAVNLVMEHIRNDEKK